MWSIVQINVWLCDLRDIEDDRRTGLGSMATLLGESASRSLLVVLVLCSWAGAAMLTGVGVDAPSANWVVWIVTLFFSAVSIVGSEPRAPLFYNLYVDGGLLLPVLLFFVVRLTSL